MNLYGKEKIYIHIIQYEPKNFAFLAAAGRRR